MGVNLSVNPMWLDNGSELCKEAIAEQTKEKVGFGWFGTLAMSQLFWSVFQE